MILEKTQNNKPMSNSIKNSDSPHFWWLIGILVFIIVGLVAHICTNKVLCAEKIMEYISYASIILSITLSVFAILYTYTSNVQIQQQFEKINSAVGNITSTSNDLTIISNKLEDNLDAILQRLESIDNKQKEITGQMNNINTKLDVEDWMGKITNNPSNIKV